MIRSALLIVSGNATTSLLLFARNLIIAHLISVPDYGIAATFAIAMAVVEMMSALGLQQQIVQSKDGDDPRFQAALQGFQVLRGVILSGVLFLLAGPIAAFMLVPDVAWAYQVMALVPVLNALTHFDTFRMNRHMEFWRMTLTGVVPALASVLVIWPLSHWFGDYRVMLYAIIVQAALSAVVSHLVAQRRYWLVLDRRLMAQSLAFGWPLLVNGILLFAVFNGDKVIVGRELGMETLAIFAMGFTLTLTPTLVMAKSVQNFFLPLLSAAARDGAPPGRFDQLAAATLQIAILNGSLMVLVIFLIGDPVVHGLLGVKYAALLPLLELLAVQQSLRVFKTGGAVVALARGKSGNAMIANLFRLLTLPVAWVVLLQGGTLITTIWIAIAGEIMGYVASLLLVHFRLGIALRPIALPLLAAAALLGVSVSGPSAQALIGPSWHLWLSLIMLGLFVLELGSMAALRRFVSRRRAEPPAGPPAGPPQE